MAPKKVLSNQKVASVVEARGPSEPPKEVVVLKAPIKAKKVISSSSLDDSFDDLPGMD